MNLYVFYLGGNAPNANIEVHDVQFAIGKTVEETYPFLKTRWFGTPDSLHIDAYGILTWADDHAVTLSPTKPETDKTLYFINMGGYAAGELKEEHEFSFIVASSANEAKAKAKKRLLPGYDHQHRDNFMNVDDCLPLDQIDGLYITLTPQKNGTPVTAEWQGYRPI